MGGSAAGLDLKYKQARTVTFQFDDVLQDAINIIHLDKFLSDALVNGLAQRTAEMLEADFLYVVTATLKGKSCTIEAKNSNEASVEVNVPELEGIVGGDVKVSGNRENATKVTFEGGIPLVFGVQAVHLIFTDGRYARYAPTPDDLTVKDIGSTTLATPGAFLRLSE